MAMINFLQHTIMEMRTAGVSLEDATFIGSESGEYECSLEEFKVLADFEFDNMSFIQTVPEDLVIVMDDDSWFSRDASEGRDWWEYNRTPTAVANPKEMVKLQSSQYYSIDLLHDH